MKLVIDDKYINIGIIHGSTLFNIIFWLLTFLGIGFSISPSGTFQIT
jgi:hypothetical protein